MPNAGSFLRTFGERRGYCCATMFGFEPSGPTDLASRDGTAGSERAGRLGIEEEVSRLRGRSTPEADSADCPRPQKAEASGTGNTDRSMTIHSAAFR